MSKAKSLPTAIGSHLLTIYLFCKSDIPTVVIPVSTMAFTTTPICSTSSVGRGIQAVIWLFLHVLQFNIANQLYSIDEDKLNHPHRPLAANRIVYKHAVILRWLLPVICLAISTLYGRYVFFTSICSGLFAFLYNETSLHEQWIFRAVFNAAGYGAFKMGTMLISGCSESGLDSVATSAFLISTGVILTTVYVQDFKDVAGDLLNNRITFPIRYPEFSRFALLPLCLGWAIFECYRWSLNTITSLLYVSFTIWVVARFMRLRTVEADRRSYFWYNMWLACCFMLPGYYRLRQGEIA